MAELLPDQFKISLIIPVLDEAEILDSSLADLFAQAGISKVCEIILCDGGSQDNTLQIASRYDCQIVHSEPGRALQMNSAARVAKGEHLLFLHADSRLPLDYILQFEPSSDWGFHRLRLDNRSLQFRIIESAINWRTRLTQVAGGDQGLHFERSFFNRLGGFPAMPLMEDVAICKLARRLASPVIANQAITSSSRRWQQKGVVRTILLMWSLRLAFWLGVDPKRLHKIYYPQHG